MPFDALPVRLGIADAPDLGLRNHRFQIIAFRFKFIIVLRGENAFWGESRSDREW